MIKPTFRLLSIYLMSTFCLGVLANDKGYFRDPALFDQHIIFTADGDLWQADINDKQAKRLSSHEAVELNARISPNGSNVAFLADYRAIPAIYLMPRQGGMSKQITFENSAVRLHQWVDDSHLLYSTASDRGMHNSWVLKIVNIDNHKVRVLPVSDAVEGTLDPQARWLYFVQFGLQVSGDNAAFYQGGARGELWKFDTTKHQEAILLTSAHRGSVSTPMLYQERLFFISNANGIDNIWSMNLSGGDVKQHTNFSDFAVRGANLHGASIVFQKGADLYIYDIASEATQKLEIRLSSDFPHLQEKVYSTPLAHFEQVSLSNGGKSAAIVARGEVAIASTQYQRIVTLAKAGNARLRYPVASGDEKQIYLISDQSGDYEIWRYSANGEGTGEQLTKNGKVMRTGLWLSPDDKLLINTDKSGKLYVFDVDKARNTLLLDNVSDGIRGLSFSADSRYLAMGLNTKGSERSRIYIYDFKEQQGRFLSSSKYASYSPNFSADGHWLYFLSDRHFQATPNSPWGDRNMGVEFDKRTQIFAFSLTGTTDFPFAPSTELSIVENHKDAKAEADIKWQGIRQRLWQVNIPASNFTKLMSNEDGLFALDEDKLSYIGFEEAPEVKILSSGVSDFQWSADKSALLVQKGRAESSQFMIIEAKGKFPDDTNKYGLSLKQWRLHISPEDEFALMFKDAWLMHRDSFYDQNMRGIDWRASYDKYLPLLTRISERSELNDIFEQMMGELNSLHSQVRGGEIEESDLALNIASLGAVFEDTDKGVRIEHIYAYDKEIIEQAPPLAMPGVNATSGDFIRSVNGAKIDSIKDLHLALMNQAGTQVLLELERKRKPVKTVVVPEHSWREPRLRYQDWVARNQQKVQALSNDIGYLHLYAMGANDLASFAREFYAQYDKPALIIDVRRNRGGNIDSIIIEKLLRRVWSFWQTTNAETWTNMQQTFRGHLVVLADQFTYSDGETFTAGIKALALGPVIGKQTAGAGVWLTGQNRLVDGGIARVAEFPVYAMDGRWITEARGIAPDIEVDNLPHASFNGEDAQLQRAIAYLQEQLDKEPIPALKALPFPAVQEAASDIK